MSIAFHQSATMRTRPASPWRPLDPRTGPVPARPGGTPSGTPAPALAARVPVTPDRFYVPRPGSPPLARPIPNEARAMAQPDGLRTALADRHVVTCSCASGGAGTTTLAAMLARRLARDGADAMLVDADLSDAAGGLDVLLGLEQDEGLRWHAVHAPLGQLNGRALRRQLPQWDGVGVLAYNPWQSGAPEWFEVQAALEALGSLDGTVIVDAGRGAMIGQVPALIEASHVVVAQLSVLGLARARAHIDWLGEVGRRSREQRDRPPGIGQPLAPMAASPGHVVAVVGVEPLGARRGRGVVPLAQAEEHLGTRVLGPVGADRRLCSDALEGLGIREEPRRHAATMTAIADAVRDACGLAA